MDTKWLDVWRRMQVSDRARVADHLVTLGVAIVSEDGEVLDPMAWRVCPKTSGTHLVLGSWSLMADARPAPALEVDAVDALRGDGETFHNLEASRQE